ncbi:MAG: hypothetical protein J4G10_00185 [Alphaproteobacteria bacterium]|nr:hypothetical protein [Alphaproteobacteria bacterium]
MTFDKSPPAKRINEREKAEEKEISRRKALAKLGIGVAVVYTAPTILPLDNSARAKILPSRCKPLLLPCLPLPLPGKR